MPDYERLADLARLSNNPETVEIMEEIAQALERAETLERIAKLARDYIRFLRRRETTVVLNTILDMMDENLAALDARKREEERHEDY